jgi:hypothetical protein
MKNFLLAALAFGLLSSSAFGQEGLEKKQYTRVVAFWKKSTDRLLHFTQP